ncbi:MAG: hypothetical protein U9Q69_05860 [Nanoarchaeota archaeon]|nr:hypothetical protein [Nanoarchaeota archaeon]
MEKKLEQMLGSEIVPDSRQTRMHETIDRYLKGTTVLYTPPVKIYDFPNSGVQLHIHGGADGNIFYGGGFKRYGENRIFQIQNSYELSMADYYLQNIGIKPIDLLKK